MFWYFMVDVYSANIPDSEDSFTKSTGKIWPRIVLRNLAGSLFRPVKFRLALGWKFSYVNAKPELWVNLLLRTSNKIIQIPNLCK